MFLVAGATDMRKLRNGSRSAVELVAQLAAREGCRSASPPRDRPGAVLAAVEALGVVYRRGEPFPYRPAWRAP